MTLQYIYSGSAFGCSLLACITDVREQRIPNALTLTSAAAGLLLHFGLQGWSGLLSSAIGGLVAGLLFAVFYAVGGMGAGDVKLIAAVGCLTGLPSIALLIIATVISGGFFAIVLAIRHGYTRQMFRNVAELTMHHAQRGAQPHSTLNLMNEQTIRIPYAVPIAVGCLAVACANSKVHLI